MENNLLLVSRYFMKFYESFCVDVCKKHDLVQMEMDILAFVANHPSLNTASDIVEVRMFTKSNVSAMVEQLIQKGLLQREEDKEDRRKIHLIIEPKANPIIKDIKKMQLRFSKELMTGFSEEEKKIFGQFIDRMLSNVMEGIRGNK